ncbi:ATP-binding protein [Roseisolibacter agri]|uniref:histidine kinase n=1 Tax=Roseisolibacter agri TaxID=2014610 RepID=A0AA37PZK5_9BACT|nr:ATP-binding protein [Roseisolibacter agri]GLC23704.1 hypothetical protein rosag_02170 [Roseisolibacter agri]
MASDFRDDDVAPLLSLELRHDADVVLARQRAREAAALLGFDAQEQTRVATAVSEIARNAFRHAGGGRVELALDGLPRPDGGSAAHGPRLRARVIDAGPGIADVDAVLAGRTATAGAPPGLGILSARRLSDAFEITSAPGAGTRVTLARALPARAAAGLTRARAAAVAADLARRGADDPLQELARQNAELLRLMDAMRRREDEVERLNRELEETNRGVLALYAELDERAKELKRASELKSRFLSNVSHELRTPLTSILNISRLMLDHTPGGLPEEQRRQLGFVRTAAQSLGEIVNDLLDLAKIEAGRVDVRPARVDVAEFLGTLRGMFRAMVASEAVTLTFDEAPRLTLIADEGKLAQVLRNLISNALKYTERGEVRVSVVAGPSDTVAFRVADTGIGIAPEHQERVFEEFSQVEGPHQRRVKGTGLGLSLSRQLARLLGGTLTLESALGVGSTFTLTIPREDTRPGAPADALPGLPVVGVEPVLSTGEVAR